jgi:hypothetical protein
MKTPTILATAAMAAGLLSSALAISANAESLARNTIELESYAVESPMDPNTYDGAAMPGFIALSFVNRGDLTATAVRFVVESARQPDTVIDDVGRFSPGAHIYHRFQNSSLSANATVHIAQVRYADGSSWNEESALPERRQAPEGAP